MTIICLLKMDSKKCISYFANLKWSHYLVLQPNKHLGDARSGTNRHKDSPVGQLSAHLLVEGILMQNISLNICTGGSRLVVCWMILLCTVYNPNQIVSYTVTPLSGFKENMTWVSHHDWRLGQLQQEVGQPIDGFLQRDFSSAQKKKSSKPEGPVANKNRSLDHWMRFEWRDVDQRQSAGKPSDNSRNDAWYVLRRRSLIGSERI